MGCGNSLLHLSGIDGVGRLTDQAHAQGINAEYQNLHHEEWHRLRSTASEADDLFVLIDHGGPVVALRHTLGVESDGFPKSRILNHFSNAFS